MELLILALLMGTGLSVATRLEQRQRINLLAAQLGPFQIEADMAFLLQAYPPAVSEADPVRRERLMSEIALREQRLARQLRAFSESFARLWGERTRVSRWRLAFPAATRLFPRASFDLRPVVAAHAEGVARAIDNATGLAERERAFLVCAELLLLQHSCHWFCRSRTVADARLLGHHRTPLDQVLRSVSEPTRREYLALTA